jgi:hypothetical protein
VAQIGQNQTQNFGIGDVLQMLSQGTSNPSPPTHLQHCWAVFPPVYEVNLVPILEVTNLDEETLSITCQAMDLSSKIADFKSAPP